MPISMSTGLRNQLLAGGSLKSIFDAGSEIRIYAGTVPASANDDIGAATLLCVIRNGGAGITFASSAAAGTLEKNPSETWSGVNSASGVATFYRHVLTADSNASSTSAPRYQGSVATVGADMNLTSASLTLGATQTIDFHSVTFAG